MSTPRVITTVAQVKIAPEATRAAAGGHDIEIVCSTDVVDRSGEIIDQSGWDLKRFQMNPVLLAAHQHSLATGSSPVIGSFVSIAVVGGELVGCVRFADTALGREHKSLYVDGHMRAVSVGFASHERETRKVDGDKVIVHTRSELYEVSAVAVGCNPDALARLRKLDHSAPPAEAPAPAADSDTREVLDELRDRMAVMADAIAELKELITLAPDEASGSSADPDPVLSADGEPEPPGADGTGTDRQTDAEQAAAEAETDTEKACAALIAACDGGE